MRRASPPTVEVTIASLKPIADLLLDERNPKFDAQALAPLLVLAELFESASLDRTVHDFDSGSSNSATSSRRPPLLASANAGISLLDSSDFYAYRIHVGLTSRGVRYGSAIREPCRSDRSRWTPSGSTSSRRVSLTTCPWPGPTRARTVDSREPHSCAAREPGRRDGQESVGR